jgi:hypothetical protein
MDLWMYVYMCIYIYIYCICMYVKWFCGICMSWQKYYTIFPNWIVGLYEIYLWAPTEMLGHWSCNKTKFCELIHSWGECRPHAYSVQWRSTASSQWMCELSAWQMLVCRKSHFTWQSAITWYQGGVWSATRIIGAIFFTEILSHTVMLHCDAASKSHVTKVICACFYVDGATAPTSDNNACCLEIVFGNTIISRGLWPHLLDLYFCDFSFGSMSKETVYAVRWFKKKKHRGCSRTYNVQYTSPEAERLCHNSLDMVRLSERPSINCNTLYQNA